MDEPRTSREGRAARLVEEHLRELAANGQLSDLPGEGAPLPEDDGGPADTWAARHVLRNANARPQWAEMRREIEERTDRLRRRVGAHRQWLHDRTRYLAEVPAERILETMHATAQRDARVRAELAAAVGELNALVRRYDLLVIPAMQLPLVSLERLGLD